MRLLAYIALPLLLANASPWSESMLVLERLTLILTGELPSATMRQQYHNGTKSLAQLANELRDSEAFERRLAYFFQEKLRITNPVEFVNMYVHPFKADGSAANHNGKVYFGGLEIGGKRNVFDWQAVSGKSNLIAYYGDLLHAPAEHHPYRPQEDSVSRHLYFRKNHYVMKLFATNAFNQGNVKGYDILKQKIEDGLASGSQQEAWQALQKVWREAEFCQHENVAKIEVNPYWDMTTTVKACPATVEDRFCGANFHKCFPYAMSAGDHDDNNFYRRQIAAAIAQEPGRMMAKIVRENKKYSEVLTTSASVVNGVYLHFLYNFGSLITKSFYSRSGRGWRVADNLLNSYPNLASLYDSLCGMDHSCLQKDGWHWLARGSDRHAGVLTTLAFHRTTNGRRAKANKMHSALLCREFVDPPGAKADPNDTRVPEFRTYCKGCHVHLEPMARFFYRWPDTGNDNIYFYDHVRLQPLRAQSYKDTSCSECEAKQGDDVAGFAAILTTDEGEAFKQCAVRHAFEFLMRRPLTSAERKNILPQYVKIYKDNDEKLWAVMEAIITAKIFTGSDDAS